MSEPAGGDGRGREDPLEPWHLPGWEPPPETGEWHEGRTDAGAPFRVPALSPEEARAVAGRVRQAALDARESVPTARALEAASRAARRLADPADPAGRRAAELLGRELGWPEELARETLDGMAEGWSPGALRGVLEAELGGPEALDGFRPAPADGAEDRLRRAAGPPLLLQVQSGSLPGVGITGVLRALLVRSGVLVRPSGGEPGLAALFAGVLSEQAPALARSVAVAWWPREADEAWRPWVKRSGKVVVYGGERAVRGVRRRLPAPADLVAYGPKLGIGVLLPDADVGGAARALARDACAYEQRGCVSPRLAFAVGGRREELARAVERALSEAVEAAPARPLSPEEAVALRSLRARYEFGAGGEGSGRGTGKGKGSRRLVGDPGELRWTVLTASEPSLESEGLPRVVRVYGVPGIDALERLLRPAEGRVQAVGYAGSAGEEALAGAAARLGAARVAPLGRVAWPPADWRHDGRHQLLPLLRWTDWERGGEPG